MTQEEKDLLIQDLCGRLSYGVRVPKGNIIYPLTGINIALGYVELAVSERISIEEVRPYLRPLSSMTEEEIYEYNKLVELDRSDKESFNNLRIEYIQNHPEYKNMPFVPMYRHIDYLNTYHFDYRGLIFRGLALKAPKGTY